MKGSSLVLRPSPLSRVHGRCKGVSKIIKFLGYICVSKIYVYLRAWCIQKHSSKQQTLRQPTCAPFER